MPGLNHPQHNNKVDNCIIGPPPHLIQELDNNSIANVFCFRAFMDKLSGVIYNDYTGDFPYISLDSNKLFCHVPLQEKHNHDHPHCRPGF
jgi:hypothetical protein